MSTLRDWAELLRVPALFTVPGDTLAGTAATGARPGGRTALAGAASMCLYSAGMALNDWADRAEDAAERPHRPLPSGRIRPGHALAAATALTAAGLGLAAAAGRRPATAAAALAATVWAYDLHLKHTPAGPAAMAAARSLDLLMGAAAATTGSGAAPGGMRRAALPAAVLGVHTCAVTAVSRTETTGGKPARPLAAAGTTALLAALTTTGTGRIGAGGTWTGRLRASLAAAYLATAARPMLHAALNPSPPLTQKAVGGGIRAMIPLQAGLAARSGAPAGAAALTALAPLARAWSRKVSAT